MIADPLIDSATGMFITVLFIMIKIRRNGDDHTLSSGKHLLLGLSFGKCKMRTAINTQHAACGSGVGQTRTQILPLSLAC